MRLNSATGLRRRWLNGLIPDIHVGSDGTYGYRRIHAELTIGVCIPCSGRLVFILTTRAGVSGFRGPLRVKWLKVIATSDGLVRSMFHRLVLNELRVTEIAGFPTREGKIYCSTVLHVCSRKFVGWVTDS